MKVKNECAPTFVTLHFFLYAIVVFFKVQRWKIFGLTNIQYEHVIHGGGGIGGVVNGP
jgi:hypothetical protein